MPKAKSGRRKFQSMDFQVGYIKKGMDILLDMRKDCDWKRINQFIELLDRLALIDDNYDALALRSRKVIIPRGASEPIFPEPTDDEARAVTSQAVTEMLNKIREEKPNVDATISTIGGNTGTDEDKPASDTTTSS